MEQYQLFARSCAHGAGQNSAVAELLVGLFLLVGCWTRWAALGAISCSLLLWRSLFNAHPRLDLGDCGCFVQPVLIFPRVRPWEWIPYCSCAPLGFAAKESL